MISFDVSSRVNIFHSINMKYSFSSFIEIIPEPLEPQRFAEIGKDNLAVLV